MHTPGIDDPGYNIMAHNIGNQHWGLATVILRHFGNLLYICSVAKMTAVTGMSNTFASEKLFKMKQIIVYRLPRVRLTIFTV